MTSQSPVHSLASRLESDRLQAIEDLANSGEAAASGPSPKVEALAMLQMALIAVREAIAAQEPRVGSGGEKPLP